MKFIKILAVLAVITSMTGCVVAPPPAQTSIMVHIRDSAVPAPIPMLMPVQVPMVRIIGPRFR